MGGETTDAFDERQRIVALLRHWALQCDTYWPGVEHTHRALLLMLANVFDGPPRDQLR